MKTEGKYILGAIHEIAKEIAKNISELFQQNEAGVYGIKRIDTGFDNDNLELFADYYGGGNGCYKEIVVGASTEGCVNNIISLLIDTIKFDYLCNENTILIVE